MRYTDLNNIGGLIYWIFIKFCKTNLTEEQSEKFWARNILVLLILGTLVGFFISKF